MKKLFLICSILLIGSISQAQNWLLAGNNSTTPGTDYLGTVDAKDFVFKTWSTERMRLLSTGELGLGTTSPSSWFHILTNGSGTVAANEAFRTQVPSSTETNWRAYRNTTQMFRLNIPSSGNAVYLLSNQGDFKIGTGNAGTIIPAFQIIGGSGSNAGAVGIADYSGWTPDARLHIKGNGYTYLFKVENSSLSTPTIQINNDEQQFYKANTYTGGSSQGAFNFDYSPNTNITDGIGTYFKAIGNSSSTFKGIQLAVTNTNSGTPTTTGFIVESTSNNASSGNNYTFMANCIGANTQNYAGQFSAVNSSTYSNTGIACNASNAAAVNAIYGESNHSTNSATVSTGVVAKGYGGTTSIGLYATSTDGTNGDVFGVKSEVFNSAFSGTNAWYGVYGSAPVQTCGTGSCAGAAGFFSGDVYASNGSYSSSDFKIKDQVQPVIGASSILAQLQAKRYVYKQSAFPQLNLANGLHYGFIAQDVELILPDMVKEFKTPARIDSAGNVISNSVDVKAIHYEEFIPLLVAGFNEQKLIIDSLINALQNPTPITNPQNRQKVTLSNVNSIILNQNDPNPFTESTRITYQIPEDVREAKIIFTNSTGSIINTVIINERGTGELEVYSSDLSKGIYNYTLVCDDKVISTKKMVKQ